MKKLLSVVLASILALSLVGCGGSDDKITIAIPNDTTNEARALLLLEDKGYIKVKDDAGITATILDIEENPYDIEFKEDMPKTLVGKVAYRLLEEEEMERLCAQSVEA